MVATVGDRLRETRSLATQTTGRLPSRSVVLALARVEVRKILLHPVFLGSMGVCGLFFARAIGSSPGGSASGQVKWLVAGTLLGLAVGGFLSINLAAQRARRDHVLELFGSLPAPDEARTLGVLLGAFSGPVLLATLAAGLSGAALEAQADIAPYIDLAFLVQIPLTMAAFGAFAVALARWLPSPVTAPVVLVGQVMTGVVWVIPWIAPTTTGIRVGRHLTYLVSFLVLAVALALIRDRRTPLRLIVAGLALALTIVAAATQIPPGGLF